MLISRVGADDGATQSDSGLNNESASDESSDSDSSRVSFEEDDRSSIHGSLKPWRVIEVDSSPSAPEPVPEATEIEFVKLGLGSSKKSRKQSKVSAALAAFEED